MNCESVQRSLSLSDGMPESERRVISEHLAGCRECVHYREDLRYVRASLRALPRFSGPAVLANKLRVLASHEQSRRQGAGEFSSPYQKRLTRARLAVRDLMRPLAVPAAGGLLSSILLFTALVDTLAFQLPAADDIPLGVYTQVTVDTLSPFGFTSHDVTVELTIDKNGHVASYSVPSGTVTRDQMHQLGKLILFTSFNPATADGHATSGKVMLKSFRINVRG